MSSRLAAFQAEMLLAVERGQLDYVLGRVSDEVMKVLQQDDSHGRVYSCPEFDDICQAAGRTRQVVAPTARRDHSVILATAMAPTGGHSKVIFDIAAADPAPRTTILLTGLHNDSLGDDLKNMALPDAVDLRIAPVSNFARRLRWVQDELAAIKPSTTYILQHHWDSIISAAVQPSLTGKLIYCHNCDHSIALGVHLPFAEHVDFNGKAFYRCKESLGLSGNRYWPLAAPMVSVSTAFLRRGTITTACCGGYEKFEIPHLRRAQRYAISYEEVVTRALSVTGGQHIHIGTLSNEMLLRISDSLARAGILSSTFQHVPFVEKLGQALVDLGVDVYMGSIPRGGGKATVEAMAAGRPLLIHSNYRSLFMSDENELYPGARTWRSLGELEAGLAWSEAQLQQHSREALRFAEAHHSTSRFVSALRQTVADEPGLPPPPKPVFQPNLLQAYWDERDAEEIDDIDDLGRDTERPNDEA